MKILEQGLIISNNKIGEDIFSITIKFDKIASNAVSGQFLQFYLPKGEMILPRPISICLIQQDKGLITLVYKVVGSGTKYLSSLKPNDLIKVLGPIGNGFIKNKDLNKVALVGGGIGAPPLLQLLKELKLENKNIEVHVYLGFRSQSILTEEFKKLGAKVYITTDDGSIGYKGNIVDLINENNINYDHFFSCGPKVMLSNLSQYAENKKIPCQVCMEERMACGIGACVGCVVEVKNEATSTYKKVCKDGPVFYSSEVMWNG